MSRRPNVMIPAALLLLVATTASAASVSTKFTQKASAWVKAEASGCTNNPGPYITLNGELKLGGVNARVILTNNAKFTHAASTDEVAEVVLIPAGESIQIAKQPSRGGVGGNPWIYLQFDDCKGNKVGSPILLGRCVQGLSPAALNFALPTSATAILSGDCSNHPGPYITLDGELKLGGLGCTIILTNNAKFTHATSADVQIGLVLIPEGKSVTFHKQPSLGGVGGNPWLYVQFCGPSGETYSSPIRIGRCVQSF